LTRVAISHREHAVGIVTMGLGQVAHTLPEERELNNARDVFDIRAMMTNEESAIPPPRDEV